MTEMTMDRRSASDDAESEIPQIDPIGTRDEIEAAEDDALEAKFDEYAAAAPTLAAAHDAAKEAYDDVYADYIRIFTKLETLNEIAQSAAVIAPGFELLEEFSFFQLQGGAAEVVANVAKYSIYAGGLTALYGFGKAAGAARGASALAKGALAVEKAQFAPGGPLAKNLKSIKAARNFKMLGAAGALVSVASAGVGIWASIENARKRRTYLEDAIESYQGWYASTCDSHDAMVAGTGQMTGEITELMKLLGFGTPDELAAYLGGAVQTAGEVQGALQSATRMLCANPPLSAADVALYTGLPGPVVSRRKALIDADPSICSI
ncbi:hypothetical protein [Poseidonocella sedimentorum]|uniref:Uncharacterized protein n=1 Tax=Poseidonocella sedimentorum TaxID=871652 RepID=A0A1I6EDY5_9RHOB|nr:hypothetical protein [Poseidonocella sedimentorum]SFR15712.1 hypothetical protein SAMN04515673_11037 [Poseidonocella sedimentorum]